jgi:SAM-dependent methyltransferase
MTSTVSAQQYHEFMLGSSFDRPIRSAFHRAVRGLLRPGATILDFGAGSGIDCKTYVQLGYKVRAYDAALEMREYLATYCRSEIDAGDVSIVDLDYPMFLGTSAPNGECVDAITANFAVLNLIPDHGQLFETFDRWLTPNGVILVSVLSPYSVRGASHWWWWRNLVRFVWAGRYSMGAGSRRTHRFGLSSLRRAAYPHFVLSRIVAQASTDKAASARSASAISLCTSVYMFVLFRRPSGEDRR